MADRHTTEKLLEGERLYRKGDTLCKSNDFTGSMSSRTMSITARRKCITFCPGRGIYQDNNKTYPVQAGMTTFCEDGSGHAVSCSGKEPLVFLAMIQKKAELL